MAITTRQTDLLVQQDWKKIYQTFQNADFTAYDFETLRKSMYGAPSRLRFAVASASERAAIAPSSRLSLANLADQPRQVGWPARTSFPARRSQALLKDRANVARWIAFEDGYCPSGAL